MVMAIKTRRTLCTTRDAAETFGVTMARVRQMAEAGQIWCERLGKSLVYDYDEVQQKAAAIKAARDAGHVRGPAPGGFKADFPASHVRKKKS